MPAWIRAALAALLVSAFIGGGVALGEAATRVFINGKPSPVFFNDGDSFRVLDGPLKDTKARLAGFNTLESYGGVHQWGTWTAKELYFLAKMGTLNGRQGTWHCTTDLKRDGYGRLLLDCPDLVADQVRQGFAHALTITDRPAPADVLALQHEAQAAKRGIWAHGVPAYILTSTHSTAEETEPDEAPYNRLVSTADGHSKRWVHDHRYKECENVCYVPVTLDPARVTAAVAALKADPAFKDGLADADDAALAEALTRYVDTTGLWPRDLVPEALWSPLGVRVNAMREAGELGTLHPEDQSCMIYVDFRRRFGQNRAACLD